MAVPKPKAEWQPAAAPGQPGFDVRAALAAPSPARALQQLLDERAFELSTVERWSRRRQVAFIVTSCCAMWMAILTVATHVVRAIA